MANQKDQKEFIDPATTTAVTGFALRSIAQAIIGWIGLEFFKKYLNKLNNWLKNKNDSTDRSISG